MKTDENGKCVVTLSGEIGRYMAVDVEVLKGEIDSALAGGARELVLCVNSDGGDVLQGIDLYAYLDRQEVPVTWVVDGVAASMMAILLSNPKHKVVASRYSMLMYHRVQGYVYGTPEEVREEAEVMEKFESQLVTMLSERMGRDAEEVRALYFADGKPHWLTAAEAKELGIVDEIVGEESSIALPPVEQGSKAVVDYYRAKITNLNKQKNDMDKPEIQNLAPKLGLSNGASDAEIIAKVEAIVAENKSLKEALEQQQASRVAELVDKAIAEKKIGADERETYMKLANADYDSTAAVLAKKSAPLRVADALQTGGKAETWDELYKAGKLQNLKESDPERYAALYKERFGREPK